MLKKILSKKLLPAVTIPDEQAALSVAEAFLKGGLNVMEITLRTEAAAASIGAIAKTFPEMNIGAGTILTAEDLAAARDAGAQFGLSPGFRDEVIGEADKQNFPFIPGVMTPSEIEKALAAGFEVLKLFPAGNLGGPGYLKSMHGPYQHKNVQFIPMGGVDRSNMESYLRCENVIAAGGSWLCPKHLVLEKKYRYITELVRESLDAIRNMNA